MRETDEALILYYYEEGGDPDEIRRALEASPELAARYRELCSVLDAAAEVEVPMPPEDYGARVWRRLRPRLGAPYRAAARGWLAPFSDRKWALAGAAAAVVVVAFLVGRWTSPAPETAPETALGTPAAQSILMATVADHLQSTEILLLELANAHDDTDLTAERQMARELGSANRLYRQAARRRGDLRMASLLDDLELLLLEVAHSADRPGSSELAEIRRRMDERDLLFKVQVVGSRLRYETEARSRQARTSRL